MVLIFFMNTISKPHVKRLSDVSHAMCAAGRDRVPRSATYLKILSSFQFLFFFNFENTMRNMADTNSSECVKQRWSPRGCPRGHILKFLVLASKPQVFKNCPVLVSRTALFFEPLKFCCKCQKPRTKFAKTFLFSYFGDRLKFFWSFFLFLENTCACVLGLKHSCPWSRIFLCPWPRA